MGLEFNDQSHRIAAICEAQIWVTRRTVDGARDTAKCRNDLLTRRD